MKYSEREYAKTVNKHWWKKDTRWTSININENFTALIINHYLTYFGIFSLSVFYFHQLQFSSSPDSQILNLWVCFLVLFKKKNRPEKALTNIVNH